MKRTIVVVLLLLISTSCIELFTKEQKSARRVEFSPIVASKIYEKKLLLSGNSGVYLKEKYVTVNIQQNNNLLNILLSTHFPENFSFETDSISKTKYSKSTFIVTLLFNNKPIETVKELENYNFGILKKHEKKLIFETEAIDLENFSTTTLLQIPLFALCQIEAGKQVITIEIEQGDVFNDLSDSTLTENLLKNKNADSRFYGQLNYEIEMPQIFSAFVETQSFELQNDETFQPSSLDFAFFKPGYPDLYFSLIYSSPTPYFVSEISKNAIEYSKYQSFNLYFYNETDNIQIWVMDNDFPSQDDAIASWNGTIKTLFCEKNVFNKFSFGFVQNFNIRATSKGVVNGSFQ